MERRAFVEGQLHEPLRPLAMVIWVRQGENGLGLAYKVSVGVKEDFWGLRTWASIGFGKGVLCGPTFCPPFSLLFGKGARLQKVGLTAWQGS
ncbi:hypothetical protein Pyn_10125 [Prunus yedoensis var. nudiflora]|uniref:Uncharacterized protein n=1 Tax=Prunus yedoensis var. nudiflora TaxID=2094558 RepID=A0A314YSM4_PRUYE|nr:hypothetical protein Pyn_10125 [Prunus yedoensis var. nudiflora]